MKIRLRPTNLIYLLILLGNFFYGQTTLTAGDIAITGFNSDNPDQFSFVILTNITAGTTINFTDNGWYQTGGFRNNEGTINWTANSNLSCGIEIVITDLGSNTYSSTYGTASETNPGFALATTIGDQILAYQGTSDSPNFITAVNFNTVGWSDATTANDSALPTGLTNGINAVSITQTDNATYNCSVTSNYVSILNSISNSANWNLNTERLSIGNGYYSCNTCSGGTVIWNGSWSGTPDLTTQVIISENYNTGNGGTQTSFNACALKLENGATLNITNSTYVRVENDLIVSSGSTINVDHSGVFVQNNNLGNITNSGNITVNKKTAYAENSLEYTYWSSPVYGADISNGLTDSQIGRRYFFNAQNFLDETKEVGNNNIAVNGQDDIDDNGNDWEEVSETSIMIPGVGYASTHNETLYISSGLHQFDYSFEGTFNNGIITVPIYRNDSETKDNNWNLIGNPYPSAINADDFFDENNDKIDGALYLWSHGTPPSETANGNESYNFTDADYAIINKTGEIAGGDGITPTRHIPSCQAFFVSMTNDASATLNSGNIYSTNVIFNNQMRVYGTSDNSQFFKSSESKTDTDFETNKIWLNLTSEIGVFNQTLIGYLNNATNTDDGPFFDAARHSSATISPIIYTIIEGSDKKFGIQGKAISSIDENEIIKLGFSSPFNNSINYKISIAKLEGNFLNNNSVWLKDNVLDISHNLSLADYPFTSTSGEYNSRFEILFKDSKTLNHAETEYSKQDSFKIINLEQNNVKVIAPQNLTIKTIYIFNILGEVLFTLKGKKNTETFNVSLPQDNLFITKVELSNGETITKKFIKN